MRHGALDMRGGGGKVVAFSRTTDGSGDWVAASSTSHYGSGADSVTLTRPGTGQYRIAWSLSDYGDRLAFSTITVKLAGDWTAQITTLSRSGGYVEFTLKTGGVATNVVSGELEVLLVFGPTGY